MGTILVVDDMAVFREPLEVCLRTAGYTTATAANGAEALAVASRTTPDLILLDLNMPVMDGITFLERLRETPRLSRVPVLVFSEVAEKPQVVKAVRLGVAGYIIKSQFSLKAMLERVGEMVGAGEKKPAPETPALKANGAQAATGPLSRAPAAIPDVDPAARLRLLKPIMTRGQVLERVQQCEQLKALSPTVAHVLKMTANTRCSVDAIAKSIGQDHAIALKILKLANSAVYTRGEPVESVQKAVVRIGMERIRQAVLNIAVVERFSLEAAGQALDTFQFWEHAIATGIIAAELAHTYAPAHADAAFTMGLLHDVGRIIYAEQLGTIYGQVLTTARELELPLEQVETRMLVMNHADVMERLLHTWKFAKDLVAPIVHHHLSADGMRSQIPAHLSETARLAIANRIANAMLLGSSGNEVVYPIEDLCHTIKLERTLLDRITSTAREQTDNIKFAMLTTSNASVWQSRRDLTRDRFARPFRPLFVSPRPELDSFRILCSELSADAEEPYSVAVVHVPTAREEDAAMQALRAAEAKEGAARLPALVLSPAGKVRLDSEAQQGRLVAALSTPLMLGRFVSAVNAMAPAR
jgi:HD-like signal output (HDOD) protein/DNA-binding NarL/FixJ family response regulator